MFPSIEGAIAIAESILPGRTASRGEIDVRWQAIILVGEFIESHPEVVCDFAVKWAKRRGRDLKTAINCCLIEHLLEHYFDLVFPKMRQAALANQSVAEHFTPYSPHDWPFGQATLPKNRLRLKRLATELQRAHKMNRAR
jgi:hypothetical protein